MPFDASVELYWGEGVQEFRLRIGEILKLEDRLDLGTIELIDRLQSARWKVTHIREILRLGIYGATDSLEKANRQIVDHFDKGIASPMEQAEFALAVLLAAIAPSAKDDPEGEAKAVTSATEANASTPPLSSPPEPEWAGRQPRSKPAPSKNSVQRSTGGTPGKKPTTRRPR